MELSELQKQVDALTQRNYEDIADMRNLAADLTIQAYMVDAVHQMLDAITSRKMELAQRIATLTLPAATIPPPQDDVKGFVGRVSERVNDEFDTSELAQAIQRIRNGQQAAAE